MSNTSIGLTTKGSKLAIQRLSLKKNTHVINEILEIAKKYSTEKSAKFINGILGSILKEYPVE